MNTLILNNPEQMSDHIQRDIGFHHIRNPRRQRTAKPFQVLVKIVRTARAKVVTGMQRIMHVPIVGNGVV